MKTRVFVFVILLFSCCSAAYADESIPHLPDPISVVDTIWEDAPFELFNAPYQKNMTVYQSTGNELLSVYGKENDYLFVTVQSQGKTIFGYLLYPNSDYPEIDFVQLDVYPWMISSLESAPDLQDDIYPYDRYQKMQYLGNIMSTFEDSLSYAYVEISGTGSVPVRGFIRYEWLWFAELFTGQNLANTCMKEVESFWEKNQEALLQVVDDRIDWNEDWILAEIDGVKDIIVDTQRKGAHHVEYSIEESKEESYNMAARIYWKQDDNPYLSFSDDAESRKLIRNLKWYYEVKKADQNLRFTVNFEKCIFATIWIGSK